MPQVVVEIHHVGSTAVPDLLAKPVIDILVAVWRLGSVELHGWRIDNLGYVNKGEHGVKGRRYLTKGSQSRDEVHVHIFQAGHPELSRHLAFRDYLIAHPQAAQAYAAHKRELAQSDWESTSDYAVAKTEFIREVERLAVQWQRGEFRSKD